MNQDLTRRQLLGGTGGVLAGVACLSEFATANAPPAAKKTSLAYEFLYALNAGTIRGQNLDLMKQIEVTAAAGYDAFEPWMSTISKFVESGGSLRDVKKKCSDLGLQICSGIGFANWVVDDDQQRAQGIEQVKRDMDLLAQIGGTHIAAPPAGANRPGSHLDLDDAAERYRAILDCGRQIGVVPQLEVWGPSANLSRGSEALYVAAQSGHPDACVLLDAYHMYKGGTAPNVLRLLGRQSVHCFHMNDYPAKPTREAISDADRIWPGDGIAPLAELLGYLAGNHCRVYLSLELFNRDYWKMPALDAARIGLTKMQSTVVRSRL